MRAFAVVAVLMLATGCQTAPPAELSTGDREAIYELSLRYQAAYRAGDWNAWTGLWTTDAVYQIPEAPAIVGREQILADAQAQIPAEIDVTIRDLEGGGKWAWGRGTWASLRPATEDMPEMSLDGSFLWVLEKQPDGSWLIDTECYNLDIPSDPPAEG